MENFVYETPTKVYFGKEEELNVGKIIAGYAPKKVLVHFGGQSASGKALILYWQSVEVLYWILLKILQTVWPIRILTCGIFPLENVYRRKHCEKVRF